MTLCESQTSYQKVSDKIAKFMPNISEIIDYAKGTRGFFANISDVVKQNKALGTYHEIFSGLSHGSDYFNYLKFYTTDDSMWNKFSRKAKELYNKGYAELNKERMGSLNHIKKELSTGIGLDGRALSASEIQDRQLYVDAFNIAEYFQKQLFLVSNAFARNQNGAIEIDAVTGQGKILSPVVVNASSMLFDTYLDKDLIGDFVRAYKTTAWVRMLKTADPSGFGSVTKSIDSFKAVFGEDGVSNGLFNVVRGNLDAFNYSNINSKLVKNSGAIMNLIGSLSKKNSYLFNVMASIALLPQQLIGNGTELVQLARKSIGTTSDEIEKIKKIIGFAEGDLTSKDFSDLVIGSDTTTELGWYNKFLDTVSGFADKAMDITQLPTPIRKMIVQGADGLYNIPEVWMEEARKKVALGAAITNAGGGASILKKLNSPLLSLEEKELIAQGLRSEANRYLTDVVGFAMDGVSSKSASRSMQIFSTYFNFMGSRGLNKQRSLFRNLLFTGSTQSRRSMLYAMGASELDLIKVTEDNLMKTGFAETIGNILGSIHQGIRTKRLVENEEDFGDKKDSIADKIVDLVDTASLFSTNMQGIQSNSFGRMQIALLKGIADDNVLYSMLTQLGQESFRQLKVLSKLPGVVATGDIGAIAEAIFDSGGGIVRGISSEVEKYNGLGYMPQTRNQELSMLFGSSFNKYKKFYWDRTKELSYEQFRNKTQAGDMLGAVEQILKGSPFLSMYYSYAYGQSGNKENIVDAIFNDTFIQQAIMHNNFNVDLISSVNGVGGKKSTINYIAKLLVNVGEEKDFMNDSEVVDALNNIEGGDKLRAKGLSNNMGLDYDKLISAMRGEDDKSHRALLQLAGYMDERNRGNESRPGAMSMIIGAMARKDMDTLTKKIKKQGNSKSGLSENDKDYINDVIVRRYANTLFNTDGYFRNDVVGGYIVNNMGKEAQGFYDDNKGFATIKKDSPFFNILDSMYQSYGRGDFSAKTQLNIFADMVGKLKLEGADKDVNIRNQQSAIRLSAISDTADRLKGLGLGEETVAEFTAGAVKFLGEDIYTALDNKDFQEKYGDVVKSVVGDILSTDKTITDTVLQKANDMIYETSKKGGKTKNIDFGKILSKNMSWLKDFSLANADTLHKLKGNDTTTGTKGYKLGDSLEKFFKEGSKGRDLYRQAQGTSGTKLTAQAKSADYFGGGQKDKGGSEPRKTAGGYGVTKPSAQKKQKKSK